MKYQPKFAQCPYLSTRGNKCSMKRVGKYCVYLKHQDNCPYYNEWVELVNYTELEETSKIEALKSKLEVFED